jgi:hypothetical protein
VGLLEVPPAYPTLVRMTPSILPNRESGPQNQPKAKVAVFISVGVEASILGIVALGTILFSLSVLLQPSTKAGNKTTIRSNEIITLIVISLSCNRH